MYNTYDSMVISLYVHFFFPSLSFYALSSESTMAGEGTMKRKSEIKLAFVDYVCMER